MFAPDSKASRKVFKQLDQVRLERGGFRIVGRKQKRLFAHVKGAAILAFGRVQSGVVQICLGQVILGQVGKNTDE